MGNSGKVRGENLEPLLSSWKIFSELREQQGRGKGLSFPEETNQIHGILSDII